MPTLVQAKKFLQLARAKRATNMTTKLIQLVNDELI